MTTGEPLFVSKIHTSLTEISKNYFPQSTSGLRSEPEIEKMTMQKLRVKYIHPQSFIQIYRVVSEEKRDQPLKNGIL